MGRRTHQAGQVFILFPVTSVADNPEGLQNGLDGAMMVVAVLILNVLHMGFLLPRKPVWKGVL
jgi:hypothetical protein